MKTKISLKILMIAISCIALLFAVERGRKNLEIIHSKVENHARAEKKYGEMKEATKYFLDKYVNNIKKYKHDLVNENFADRDKIKRYIDLSERNKTEVIKRLSSYDNLLNYHSYMHIKYKYVDNFISAFIGFQQTDPPEPPVPPAAAPPPPQQTDPLETPVPPVDDPPPPPV